MLLKGSSSIVKLNKMKKTSINYNKYCLFILIVISSFNFNFIGTSKKAAKRECCIEAIKYFWQFDFNTIEDDNSL